MIAPKIRPQRVALLPVLPCLFSLGLVDCASPRKAADRHAAQGQHELATYFFALDHRQEPNDEAKRLALVQSVEAALTTIKADFDDRKAQGDHRGALGAAIRKSDVLSFARGQGLRELDARSARPELDTALPLAAAQALRDVDAAASGGDAEGERLARLREALALDPNNAELASRYGRVREGLRRTVVPRSACATELAEPCEELTSLLLTHLTRERREVTEICSEQSQEKDTVLAVQMAVTLSDTEWKRVKHGKAKGKTPRLNRFKEHEVNKKGKKQYDKVTATYEVFERTARAVVIVRAKVQSLGPSREVFFERELTATKKDKRSYITWVGDERALGGLKSHGTDQSPPVSATTLARQAAEDAAATVAKELLAKLERVPS